VDDSEVAQLTAKWRKKNRKGVGNIEVACEKSTQSGSDSIISAGRRMEPDGWVMADSRKVFASKRVTHSRMVTHSRVLSNSKVKKTV